MNTFKRKALFVIFAVLALGMGGCGSAEKRYETALQDTNDRIERMRKEEANADVELAKALQAVAAKDPGMAAMAISNIALARALRGGGASSSVAFVQPQRPRDFVDYLDAGARLFGAVGGVAVPIVGALENGKTIRAGYDRDVSVEQVRQVGETSRIQSVAQIASDVAGRPPTSTTYNFGRDGTVGGNMQNNNSTTTTTTCSAGTGASGGAGGSGGTGATSPGASGATGGSGGNAC